VGRKLPVLSTSRNIWRDIARQFLSHPALWIGGLALHGAVHVIDILWARKPGLSAGEAPWWLGLLTDAAFHVLLAAVLIPAALATHRSVILGAIEPPTAILADGRRMLRYGVLEMIIIAALMALASIGSLAARWGAADSAGEMRLLAAISASAVLFALMYLLILRAAACFPAVAVGEGWPHVADAWRALKGQSLRLIALTVLTPIGPLTAAWLAAIILPRLGDVEPVTQAGGLAPTEIGLIVLTVLMAYGWVITMSHIYKATLGRTPGGMPVKGAA
jgi:hypothetical protein